LTYFLLALPFGVDECIDMNITNQAKCLEGVCDVDPTANASVVRLSESLSLLSTLQLI
jgi:hypothetical protein